MPSVTARLEKVAGGGFVLSPEKPALGKVATREAPVMEGLVGVGWPRPSPAEDGRGPPTLGGGTPGSPVTGRSGRLFSQPPPRPRPSP